MKQNEPISKIMSTQITSVDKFTKISQVKALFIENNFRHLPVLENEKLVGMITTNDMLQATFSQKVFGDEKSADAFLDTHLAVSDIMTHNPKTVSPKTSIRDTAEIFTENPFNALPVVEENNHIVGLITTKDLLNFLLKQY